MSEFTGFSPDAIPRRRRAVMRLVASVAA